MNWTTELVLNYCWSYKLLEQWNYMVAQNITDKTKIEENIPSLEVFEVVLVQCHLVDNQYQQTSEVLYTLVLNKSYANLLNLNKII